MRRTLILAVALVALAIPAGSDRRADRRQAGRDPDQRRQRQGDRRHQAPVREEGPHRAVRRPHERRHRGAPARVRHREDAEEGHADGDPVRREGSRSLRARAAPSGRAARPADGQALTSALLPRVLAHGIGGVQDLPVPAWLFYWGGAVVLVVSFIALGALWKTPQLERHATGRDLGAAFSRFVLGPLRILVQAISVFLFVVVLVAALFGTSDPTENLAPTWIYVIFWLGLPFLSLLFGNVWRALSPWRALADAFVWLWERTGREARPLAAYPERARPLPRSRRAVRVRRPRALLLRSLEPSGACFRDRPLLVHRALRHGRVRPRDLDGAGRGLRDPLRVHRADRTARCGRRPHSPADSTHGARRSRADSRDRSSSSRSRSARSASTATAARSRGRTSSLASRRRTSSIAPERGSSSSPGSTSAA